MLLSRRCGLLLGTSLLWCRLRRDLRVACQYRSVDYFFKTRIDLLFLLRCSFHHRCWLSRRTFQGR